MNIFAPNSEREICPRSLFWILIGAGLVVADQIVKQFAFSHLPVGFGNVYIGLTQFKNFYFAFNLPVPLALMYALYAAVLGGILIYLRYAWFNLPDRHHLAWVFIVAGAVSNIGERIALGYVRDFIHIFWGYFNLADVYIAVGIVMLLTISVRKTPTNY